MSGNIINAAFCGTSYITTRPAWLIDYGMVLKLSGIELPEVYEVDFANSKNETATRVLGGPDGVTIPDQYFLAPHAQQIFAWLYLHVGEDDGYTRIQVTIPINKRPDVTDVPPTPVEHSIIEQAIAALNTGVERAETAAENAEEAVEHYPKIVDGFWYVWIGGQWVDTGVQAEGEDGAPGPQGPKGDKLTYDDLTPADKADLIQGPIAEAQTAAVAAVNQAGTTQISAVNQAGAAQVSAVNQAGTAQVSAVNQAGTTQVDNVNTAGAAQVQAVEDKGEEVLESIPSDYSDLSAEVSDLKNDKAPVIIDTASGTIANFPDGSDGMPLKSLTVNVEPVQAGSGDPSPTNVRPISGWTSATVTRCGKNLFDKTAEYQNGKYLNADGTTSDYSGFAISGYINASPSTSYVVSGVSGNSPSVCCYDKDKRYLGGYAYGGQSSKAFTTPVGTAFIRLTIILSSIDTLQLELGSTATAYEPYQGNTYSVSWQSEAGTIYGGTLTVNDDGTGTLLVDSVKCPMWTPQDSSDWKLAWGYDSARVIFSRYAHYEDAPQNGLYWPANNSRVFCECYKNVADFSVLMNTDYAVMAGYQSTFEGRLVVKDSRFTDAVSLNQWLRNNNVYASYRILPQFQQTYQLTAQQVINTLYGQNNIWADVGPVDVKYRADTGLYINKKITELQALVLENGG